MFYITKYNYYKNIIFKLDIDIPAIEKTGFFNNYKLDLFDLNLSYFTKNEREALIISDHLFRNISNINKNMIFKQIKREESHWVYKLSMPAYHADRHCPNLAKEFNNIRIPSSLNPKQAKEYRQFFIDNKDRYGNKAGLIEPRVFARKLKEKFNLNENLDELLENHILPEIRENSGVECINITLEQFIGEINELINIFKNFIREEQVSASFSRRSWLSTKEDSELSKEERESMQKVYEQKRIICARILAFHFQHFEKEGFNISENLLEMLGFQACPNCCKHIIPF
ncbi:hypothetical protein [uncultured Aggregatibacter sp.]|mgnify:FL=1|uniref:hypothetical protein n=1 Tax=uncultured Aggregatibacter sp. TaxID=470564 RepID=UPI002602B439|nr:hypothetical protein [uncultured Aggregatibacter sp.]